MWEDITREFEAREQYEYAKVWHYREEGNDLMLSIASTKEGIVYHLLGSARLDDRTVAVQEHFYTPEQVGDFLKRFSIESPKDHGAEWFWLTTELKEKKLSV